MKGVEFPSDAKLCGCLPHWIKGPVIATWYGHCATCDRPVPKTRAESMCLELALIPCPLAQAQGDKNTAHILQLLFHGKTCAALFHAKMHDTGKAHLFDSLPGKTVQDIEGMSEAEQQAMVNACLTAHALTGNYCDACGTFEQSGAHAMQVCSNCKDTRYCNRECQLLAWPVHKKVCNKK